MFPTDIIYSGKGSLMLIVYLTYNESIKHISKNTVMYRYVNMNNTDMVVRLSENFRPFPIPIYLHFCLIISNIQEYMFETPIMTFFYFYPSNTFYFESVGQDSSSRT